MKSDLRDLLNEQVTFSSVTGFYSPMFFLKSVIGFWEGFSLFHISARTLWRNRTSRGYIEKEIYFKVLSHVIRGAEKFRNLRL